MGYLKKKSYLTFFYRTAVFFSAALIACTLSTKIGWAEALKPALNTKVIFKPDATAKISYQTHGKSKDEIATNKLQTALIFYAYSVKATEAKSRPALLNQSQKIVFQVASEQGLARPNILKNNSLAQVDATKVDGKGFEMIFGALPGKGNTLQVKEIADKSPQLYQFTTFWLFQDQIKNLPDNGLRIMVLALGAMNQWYRENMDKISEPSSIATASSHGLKTALEIMEAVGKAGAKS